MLKYVAALVLPILISGCVSNPSVSENLGHPDGNQDAAWLSSETACFRLAQWVIPGTNGHADADAHRVKCHNAFMKSDWYYAGDLSNGQSLPTRYYLNVQRDAPLSRFEPTPNPFDDPNNGEYVIGSTLQVINQGNEELFVLRMYPCTGGGGGCSNITSAIPDECPVPAVNPRLASGCLYLAMQNPIPNVGIISQ